MQAELIPPYQVANITRPNVKPNWHFKPIKKFPGKLHRMGPMCKGVCRRYKFVALTRKEQRERHKLGIGKRGGRQVYARGQCFCRTCQVYLKEYALRCPCCKMRTRKISRHYGKNKKKKYIT